MRIHICKKTAELGANAARGKMNKWLLDWKFKQGEQDKEVTEGYVCQNIVMNWDNVPHSIYGECWNVEDETSDEFTRCSMSGNEEFEIFAAAWYLEKDELSCETSTRGSEATIWQGDNALKRSPGSDTPWGDLHAFEKNTLRR